MGRHAPDAAPSGPTPGSARPSCRSSGPASSATGSLIVAPLAVCPQTVREAAKIGVDRRLRPRRRRKPPGPASGSRTTRGCGGFDPAGFDAVVLDEASILKQSDGKTRSALIEWARDVKYRLACTATPAPNDVEELTSQAEWVGAMTRAHMLAGYFVHDSDAGWRLKGHARRPMLRWMGTWAVALRRPSDLGYADDGYDLPGLDIVPHLLPVDLVPEDQLFATDLGGVGGRRRSDARPSTPAAQRVAELVNAEPDEPWVLWCGLNDEAECSPGSSPTPATSTAAWSAEDKAAALLGFADGNIRVLITKPSIAAFGLNWQHCARMAFVGLSDSYETYYQAIRRCYRYGQTARRPRPHRPVRTRGADRREHRPQGTRARLCPRRPRARDARRPRGRRMTGNTDAYITDDASGEDWRLMLGDSCERLAEMPDESVDLSVYSPPFASLFTYSPSLRDLGNSGDRQEFLDHYALHHRRAAPRSRSPAASPASTSSSSRPPRARTASSG